MRQALAVRRAHLTAFGPEGDYVPLAISDNAGSTEQGDDALVAFARGGEVVTVVPRFGPYGQEDRGDAVVSLPEGAWRNVLTDEYVEGSAPASDLLRRFPVALLVRE